jgi:hypothetical protein
MSIAYKTEFSMDFRGSYIFLKPVPLLSRLLNFAYA